MIQKVEGEHLFIKKQDFQHGGALCSNVMMVNKQVKSMMADKLTSKVSSDKGLQVLEDVLSYTHFQVIGCKIGYKRNTHTRSHLTSTVHFKDLSHDTR